MKQLKHNLIIYSVLIIRLLYNRLFLNFTYYAAMDNDGEEDFPPPMPKSQGSDDKHLGPGLPTEEAVVSPTSDYGYTRSPEVCSPTEVPTTSTRKRRRSPSPTLIPTVVAPGNSRDPPTVVGEQPTLMVDLPTVVGEQPAVVEPPMVMGEQPPPAVGEQPTEVEPPTLAAKVKEEPAVKLEPVESAVAEVEPTETELKKQSPQEEVEQNKAAEVDPAETNQPFQKENEQNTAAKVDPEETELKKKPFQEEDEQNKLDAEKYRKMKAQKNQREKRDNEKNRKNRKSRSNSSCWRRSSEGKDPERCSGAGKISLFNWLELKQFVWTLLCGILQ